jgi:hypothetical protein
LVVTAVARCVVVLEVELLLESEELVEEELMLEEWLALVDDVVAPVCVPGIPTTSTVPTTRKAMVAANATTVSIFVIIPRLLNVLWGT